MRELRRNMRIIGVLLLVLFIGAGIWYAVTAFEQGSQWASNVYNKRLARSSAERGDITDRDRVVLASTDASGSRVYLTNSTARKALSQVIGDTAGMSGTGIETMFSSQLLDISTSLVDRLKEAFSGSRHTGSSVQITIDAELQAYTASIFPTGYKGAVCILNYKTGEILAMVSMPNYDPSVVNYSREGVADSAYLNRCLQGLYTPGSVFKIVTLTAALETDSTVTRNSYTCQGTWKCEDGIMRCMSGNKSHGTLNLKSAFAASCNVTFAKLSYQMGAARLREVAENFGFNENFKFGDFIIYNSSFPKNLSSTNRLLWAGIGQDEVLVTPLHMAMIAGSVANDGIMMQPYLVSKITSNLGLTTRRGTAREYRRVMSSATARTVASYMKAAVESGTASKAQISGYTVCGKTGSAETSNDKQVATNAWFVGYLQNPDHPYAVAVVIEQGGSGGNLATSLGGKALKYAIRYAG